MTNENLIKALEEKAIRNELQSNLIKKAIGRQKIIFPEDLKIREEDYYRIVESNKKFGVDKRHTLQAFNLEYRKILYYVKYNCEMDLIKNIVNNFEVNDLIFSQEYEFMRDALVKSLSRQLTEPEYKKALDLIERKKVENNLVKNYKKDFID